MLLYSYRPSVDIRQARATHMHIRGELHTELYPIYLSLSQGYCNPCTGYTIIEPPRENTTVVFHILKNSDDQFGCQSATWNKMQPSGDLENKQLSTGQYAL